MCVASGSEVNAFMNSKSRQIFQLLRMHGEDGSPFEVTTLTICFSPMPLNQVLLSIASFMFHTSSQLFSVCVQASARVKALRLQKLFVF